MMGHNSKALDEEMSGILQEYSESLKRSAEENDVRSKLRERVKDKGHDTKALMQAVSWAKSSLKVREGFDESLNYFKTLVANDGGAESLFSWVIEREEKKQEERAAAKEAKKKERDEAKAKDDEFKPAAERKPKGGKVVSGKSAASGENADNAENDEDEPSVGAQQAAAYQKAHG